ncbi:autophagy protein atg9 [Claviceps digitariae]|nr:autophagy protein atg9 [Claviceps digitariae]
MPPNLDQERFTQWTVGEEDIENDVPASLLVETSDPSMQVIPASSHATRDRSSKRCERLDRQPKAQWQPATRQNSFDSDYQQGSGGLAHPRSLARSLGPGGHREKALWRWVNISNLDGFMRDVYDYYEGGGMLCILCSNALWLLKIPGSKSLSQVVVQKCTRKMSFTWSLGIWLYSFFFIWKSVQYFFELRRLMYVRNFFIHLLSIPEQDMQTISWQDVVARIMILRDDNPKTATNIPRNVRRFIGSQSKERLDAHDIANRLMRKDNFLIAMINKDIIDLSLPLPFIQGKQLFSKTMEWYLHYCILDMAFNEFGQVRQDFLRADKRSVLSHKLRQRLYFAGFLNLIFAPVVLAYVVIVYFFTYYNEYQKDPKLAAARKYTALAEWKFREFNELPHIFYERLHMSIPFATHYIDQFPKRVTEELARSVSFMSGAITAILALCTILDSELFLGFEITHDRTVLFYLGIFGGIWAITRGMVSEDTIVFNPEFALRNVIEYTHFMPDHWRERLHSFEVKKEFSELYKMKVVIFLEEILGIITTPMLLLFALPKCAERIIDFFREFTIHVDGLGYVCSFAVFDFKKGVGHTAHQRRECDVREDYYSTKHGKMAASYYGFLDNYVINPKIGVAGQIPPGSRQQFHMPPVFPGLNSPSLAVDMQISNMVQPGFARHRTHTTKPPLPKTGEGDETASIAQTSPMTSILLDPRNQPSGPWPGPKSPHQHHHVRNSSRKELIVPEQSFKHGSHGRKLTGANDAFEEGGLLGDSTWETSPGHGFSRANSSTNSEDPDAGVLGLIYQLRQAQRGRRGGVV